MSAARPRPHKAALTAWVPFVLPPADPHQTAHHIAKVRIFTPDRKVPFAGHPNIGTAFLLASERMKTHAEPAGQFVFEEQARLVEVTLLRDGSRVKGAELLSPERLSLHTTVSAEQAAVCLGLSAIDVRTENNLPRVALVGLPFLLVELASRDALSSAKPDRAAYDNLFPLDVGRAIHSYVRDGSAAADCDLHSRMFTWRLVEDPATGSATAAVAASLAQQRGQDVYLRVIQGEDMGRPSEIMARSITESSGIKAYVAGRCAIMFQGSFDLG